MTEKPCSVSSLDSISRKYSSSSTATTRMVVSPAMLVLADAFATPTSVDISMVAPSCDLNVWVEAGRSRRPLRRETPVPETTFWTLFCISAADSAGDVAAKMYLS